MNCPITHGGDNSVGGRNADWVVRRCEVRHAVSTPLVTDCRSQPEHCDNPKWLAGCQRTRRGPKSAPRMRPRRSTSMKTRTSGEPGSGCWPGRRVTRTHQAPSGRSTSQGESRHRSTATVGTHGIGKGNPCYLGLVMFFASRAPRAPSSASPSCFASSVCTTGRRLTAGPGWTDISSTPPVTRSNDDLSLFSSPACARPESPAVSPRTPTR